MKSSLHRAGVAIATAAVTATLALAPTAAHAATSTQATAATGWLASELPDDGIVKVNFGGTDYADYGLTLDFALAFQGIGTESGALGDIVDALSADPATFTEYTSNVGFGDREDSQIAGATAKLATLVQLAGGNATSFAGHDLVDEVESVVVDDGAAVGRASDISDFGDNSNSIGQSFAVRALASAGSSELTAAADYLVKQQCDNGVFRINMSDAGCGAVDGGDTTSIDTTAFAVEALIAARDGGYDDATAAITDAVDYLAGAQDADGSFLDTGSNNSNSTGLAAAALAAGGESAAATKAADFVADLQVPSGANAGAVAYDQAAFDDGTTGTLGDQWRRTTAQGAIGLVFATQASTDPDPDPEPGPVAAIRSLTPSDSTPTQGDTITVTVIGEDADGVSTGDVSDDVTLTSSVDSDTIDGNKVTFNHASPHTITATYPGVEAASITVQVSPLAAETPTASTGGGSTVSSAASSLPDTGSLVQPWQLAAAAGLLVLGAGLVIGGRRRAAARSTDDR